MLTRVSTDLGDGGHHGNGRRFLQLGPLTGITPTPHTGRRGRCRVPTRTAVRAVARPTPRTPPRAASRKRDGPGSLRDPGPFAGERQETRTMASRYRYGAAFEERVRDNFEDANYYVMRSAGSAGVADLVALDMLLPKARPILVQCKRAGAKALSVDAWNHFLRIAQAAGAVPLLAAELAGAPLQYDLVRILAPRAAKSRLREVERWELDPDRDRPRSDSVIRPALCECGHSPAEHDPASSFCGMCPCAAFTRWQDAVQRVQDVIIPEQPGPVI